MSYYPPSQPAPRASSYSRLMKHTTMMRVRWLGIVGQSATLLFVYFFLNLPIPIIAGFAIMALSTGINIFLQLYYPRHHHLTPVSTALIIALDVVLLSALLYLSGGLQNPFALLLMAPTLLGAGSLTIGYIVGLNLLVIMLASGLSFFYMPLPWYNGEIFTMPALMIEGNWAAIVSTLLFVTAYSYRIAEEARQLADALAAMELALQHEQHLSVLDGLAAAAAHELGTPLATIQLVAKELQHQLGQEGLYGDDMELLVSQSQRCREILARLTSLATEEDSHRGQLPLTSLLEEVIAPHRDFGIDIACINSCKNTEEMTNEPIIKRNPAIFYGLGNLVENAVDFATSRIIVEYQWTTKDITITITDDGKGFASNILGRIGEPYTTSREQPGQAGGLGLGLFIARTLLERNGAQLWFGNSSKEGEGAQVRIIWPLNALLA